MVIPAGEHGAPMAAQGRSRTVGRSSLSLFVSEALADVIRMPRHKKRESRP